MRVCLKTGSSHQRRPYQIAQLESGVVSAKERNRDDCKTRKQLPAALARIVQLPCSSSLCIGSKTTVRCNGSSEINSQLLLLTDATRLAQPRERACAHCIAPAKAAAAAADWCAFIPAHKARSADRATRPVRRCCCCCVAPHSRNNLLLFVSSRLDIEKRRCMRSVSSLKPPLHGFAKFDNLSSPVEYSSVCFATDAVCDLYMYTISPGHWQHRRQ